MACGFLWSQGMASIALRVVGCIDYLAYGTIFTRAMFLPKKKRWCFFPARKAADERWGVVSGWQPTRIVRRKQYYLRTTTCPTKSWRRYVHTQWCDYEKTDTKSDYSLCSPKGKVLRIAVPPPPLPLSLAAPCFQNVGRLISEYVDRKNKDTFFTTNLL